MKGAAAQNKWVLFLLLLAGVVLGGFLGDVLGQYPALQWLTYGKTFGLTTPLVLDFHILTLQLGITVRFTLAGLLGMALSVLIYRKML